VQELQPCREWQFFHDLLEAPAGDLHDPIGVDRKPVGAV
jgi:hypothetical protein